VLQNRLLENSGKRYHKGFEDFNYDFLFVGNIENLKDNIKTLCKAMDARRECSDLNLLWFSNFICIFVIIEYFTIQKYL